MTGYEGDNSSGISFRLLFFLAAIIFLVFGFIFPGIPSLFYIGMTMLILWILINLIGVILGLDK